MIKEIKSVIKIAIWGLVIFIIAVLIMLISTVKESVQRNDRMRSTYSSISFNGEVLKVNMVWRGGRSYALMCIKIDTANVSDFYRFDDESCLKISNNIATMPIGCIGDLYNKEVKFILLSKYVEVNMNNNGKILFYDLKGNIISKDLNFKRGNIIESDLKLCN
jgi:hypothetical protein